MADIGLYTRKSKGMPAEVQLKRLRVAAAAEGHNVVLEATDVATGTNPHRPGWDAMVRAVKGGTVRQVWMTKMDRAMRSARHYLTVVEDVLEPRGCLLRFIDQPMACVTDYKDPLARAFRGMGAVFAELEVNLADERSNEGHEFRDGRWYGPSGAPVGRVPEYGDGHKFRVRAGRRVHDKARCKLCGETGGSPTSLSDSSPAAGVAEPNGCATPEAGL